MSEFPRNSPFELGRHKFISDEEFDRALKTPYERLAKEVNVALIRRSLEDLRADLEAAAMEGESPEEYAMAIARLTEIIADLN